MQRIALATVVVLSLTACDRHSEEAPSGIPQSAVTGAPMTRDQADAAEADLRRLKPSMAKASAVLRTMSATERRATTEQLKCIARRTVEAGGTPEPRTVELVERARSLAMRSRDGSCAEDVASSGGGGRSMGPASSKAGGVGPAAIGADRPDAPATTAK